MADSSGRVEPTSSWVSTYTDSGRSCGTDGQRMYAVTYDDGQYLMFGRVAKRCKVKKGVVVSLFVLATLVVIATVNLYSGGLSSAVAHSLQPPAFSDEISTLLDACASLNATVFLMEPRLLERLVEDKELPQDWWSRNNSGSAFNVVTFGVLEQDLLPNEEQFVADAMRKHRYKYVAVEGRDPRPISVSLWDTRHINRTTHHLFVRRGRVIHLVVFFGRRGYWWHGAVGASVPSLHRLLPSLTFGEFPGAFDDLQLSEASRRDGRERVFTPHDSQAFLKAAKISRFIDCDAAVARSVQRKHGNLGTDSEHYGKMASRAYAALYFKRVMKKLGKLFWLTNGSLLGWYRQCGIIPHDHDVDFGMWAEDYEPSLRAVFENNPVLKLCTVWGNKNDSFQFALWGYHMKVDIFFLYKTPDGMHTFHGVTGNDGRRRYSATFPAVQLCTTEFLGEMFHVPCTPSLMLDAEYGTNWREPNVEYDYQDALNLRKRGAWKKQAEIMCEE
ncbi:PREDICTED: fukutin-like [Priapulus caudatus]|uniref:Fukutin-like n=1 Tax=Priapulus caudatus TaxID=37621 RepID=A0ABM1E2C4_PRICU|nr:PREDICTED: fukutin-like [Priapulus caudatus]